MGAQIANGAGAVLIVLYIVVFAFGVMCLAIGFGSSLWRACRRLAQDVVLCLRAPEAPTISPLWQRLSIVIRIAAWVFFVSYAVVVLFWMNRASLPEVLAYAGASAFALFAIRRTRSAQAPQSSGVLASFTAVVAACIAAYSWGLYSAIARGWSESGYFVVSQRCGTIFDRCIESGPYATPDRCRHELVAVNGSLDTYACIELQDVPRAYLPWAR